MTEPTLVLAFAAGVASFASPCMLPVMPAFLAQLGSVSLVRTQDLGRRDLLLGALMFEVGFSLVFFVLDVALSAALEEVATETLAWLSRVAGGSDPRVADELRPGRAPRGLGMVQAVLSQLRHGAVALVKARYNPER